MTSKEIGTVIYTTAASDGMPGGLCALIEAQSKHETGDYTSNAFLKNNNCFGYKYVVGGRWQNGAGILSTEKNAYASYDNIENSVHELCAWILRRRHEGKFPADLATITEPRQYATLLKTCGYYGDPLQNYINGLTHYLQN
jgi:uncharacterized FlgJ-related protein